MDQWRRSLPVPEPTESLNFPVDRDIRRSRPVHKAAADAENSRDLAHDDYRELYRQERLAEAEEHLRKCRRFGEDQQPDLANAEYEVARDIIARCTTDAARGRQGAHDSNVRVLTHLQKELTALRNRYRFREHDGKDTQAASQYLSRIVKFVVEPVLADVTNTRKHGTDTHAQEPPTKKHHSAPNYRCDVCDRSFTEQRALRRHQRTIGHAQKQGVQPDLVICPICRQTFTRSFDCQRHINMQHLNSGDPGLPVVALHSSRSVYFESGPRAPMAASKGDALGRNYTDRCLEARPCGFDAGSGASRRQSTPVQLLSAAEMARHKRTQTSREGQIHTSMPELLSDYARPSPLQQYGANSTPDSTQSLKMPRSQRYEYSGPESKVCTPSRNVAKAPANTYVAEEGTGLQSRRSANLQAAPNTGPPGRLSRHVSSPSLKAQPTSSTKEVRGSRLHDTTVKPLCSTTQGREWSPLIPNRKPFSSLPLRTDLSTLTEDPQNVNVGGQSEAQLALWEAIGANASLNAIVDQAFESVVLNVTPISKIRAVEARSLEKSRPCCPICRHIFDASDGFAQHFLGHLDDWMREHECEQCGFAFVCAAHLEAHRLAVRTKQHCGFRFQHSRPCTGHHGDDCGGCTADRKRLETYYLLLLAINADKQLARGAGLHHKQSRWTVGVVRHKGSYDSFSSLESFWSAPTGSVSIEVLAERFRTVSISQRVTEKRADATVKLSPESLRTTNTHHQNLWLNRSLVQKILEQRSPHIEDLLQSGANVNARVEGMTSASPLAAAITRQNSGAVRLLVRKGANVRIEEVDDGSPVSLAVGASNCDIARILVHAGALNGVPNKAAKSWIQQAIKINNRDMEDLLIANFPEVNQMDLKNRYGCGVRSLILYNTKDAVAKKLGTFVGVGNRRHQLCSYLYWAAACLQTFAVTLLVRHAFDKGQALAVAIAHALHSSPEAQHVLLKAAITCYASLPAAILGPLGLSFADGPCENAALSEHMFRTVKTAASESAQSTLARILQLAETLRSQRCEVCNTDMAKSKSKPKLDSLHDDEAHPTDRPVSAESCEAGHISEKHEALATGEVLQTTERDLRQDDGDISMLSSTSDGGVPVTPSILQRQGSGGSNSSHPLKSTECSPENRSPSLSMGTRNAMICYDEATEERIKINVKRNHRSSSSSVDSVPELAHRRKCTAILASLDHAIVDAPTTANDQRPPLHGCRSNFTLREHVHHHKRARDDKRLSRFATVQEEALKDKPTLDGSSEQPSQRLNRTLHEVSSTGADIAPATNVNPESLAVAMDVDIPDVDGRTSLHHAAESGQLAVVEELLYGGADFHALDHKDCTAMLLAARAGHDAIVDVLIRTGADIDWQENGKPTALHLAVLRGEMKTVETLLEYGANGDRKAHGSFTALYYAAGGHHFAIAERLLDHRVNINLQCGDYGSALYVAAASGAEDLVELLVGRGANVLQSSRVLGTPLHGACTNARIKIVQYLLAQSPQSVQVTGGEFGSALCATVSRWDDAPKRREIVRMIVETPMPSKWQGPRGTALTLAQQASRDAVANSSLNPMDWNVEAWTCIITMLEVYQQKFPSSRA